MLEKRIPPLALVVIVAFAMRGIAAVSPPVEVNDTLRVVVAIILFGLGTLTQAAQMLPMIQTFPVEANSVLQDAFHVESTQVRIFATNVDSSEVSITLPDGTTMAEGNAESFGFVNRK